MNKTGKGTLLVLETGLFPDAATLDEAVGHAPETSAIQRRKIVPDKMDDAAWDRLLGDILAARTILTL